MTSIADAQLTTSLLVPLASAAARALALGGVAGLGLAAFRVKTTTVRLFTWTAVLYAAFAMPLLERVLPSLAVPTPTLLPYSTERSSADTVNVSQPMTVDTAALNPESPAQSTPAPLRPWASVRFSWSVVRWNVVAVGIYLAVAFFLFGRFFVGLAFGHRLQREATIIDDQHIATRLAARAQGAGLSFIPVAGESAFISVPVTMGVLRPTILLPTTWREWDDTKLDAVIVHEMSHVARRDTFTQRLALLHCTFFWFSPLAWWLNQHLADLMEQASDEAALAGGVDRKAYARTLLGFFEALQTAPGRVWWQGVAMATAGRAERRAEERVEKILVWKGAVAMRLKKSMAVVVVALVVPLVYVTASARPAGHDADSQTSNTVLIAQNTVTPPPPSTPRTARAPKKSSSHSFYSFNNDDELPFVIASGKNDSVTMSGMRDNWEIDELRKKISGDFIWFRRDGKSYVIRDQATIDRARSFWAPQEELGKKQEELGRQQEALGKQQEELSTRMEQIHVKVPDMTRELEKLQAELKKLNSSATMEQIGQIQSAIGDLQSKIGDVQSQAGEQQGKLGEEMGALGEKQGKLGEQQGELGRQQGELAEQATRQMKQLLDESITKGTAQIEPQAI